jgi:DNA polymerase III subunit delta'
MNLEYYKNNFPFLIRSLQNIKKNNRMAHAYILHCDNSELREDFALFIVKFFLCENNDIENKPCDSCSVCNKINKRIYPDLHILEPTSKTRKIKIGSTDERDTLRWFQNQFSLSSMTAGGYKAGIINEVDCLMPQAQNAFLKTLEEPTKKTFFILATENPGALLPTIRSRCQILSLLTNSCVYDFEGSGELFQLLKELVYFSENNFSKVVEISEKINLLFTSLYMQAEAKMKNKWNKRLEEAENLESKTAKKQFKDRYTAAVESEYRLLRKYFLDGIYTWFAQVYQLSSGIKNDLLSNPEILINNDEISNIAVKDAQKYLDKAGSFVKCFSWNINESLAIQEFCLSFFKVVAE